MMEVYYYILSKYLVNAFGALERVLDVERTGTSHYSSSDINLNRVSRSYSWKWIVILLLLFVSSGNMNYDLIQTFTFCLLLKTNAFLVH